MAVYYWQRLLLPCRTLWSYLIRPLPTSLYRILPVTLAVSSTQGTWVVTSHAVAEAICVPLTGWLAGRFGTVRVFIFGLIGFTVFSFLCGLATSLEMLVFFRIGQGLCGGPLMPLSQTLLIRIFPQEKHAQAMGLWAMTTVVGPRANFGWFD